MLFILLFNVYNLDAHFTFFLYRVLHMKVPHILMGSTARFSIPLIILGLLPKERGVLLNWQMLIVNGCTITTQPQIYYVPCCVYISIPRRIDFRVSGTRILMQTRFEAVSLYNSCSIWFSPTLLSIHSHSRCSFRLRRLRMHAFELFHFCTDRSLSTVSRYCCCWHGSFGRLTNFCTNFKPAKKK